MQFHPSITIASSSSSSSAAGRINDDEPINICIHQENGQQSKNSHLLLSVTVWQSSGSRTSMSKGQIQRSTSNPVWRGDPFWPTRPQQSRCTQKFSPPTAPHSSAGEFWSPERLAYGVGRSVCSVMTHKGWDVEETWRRRSWSPSSWSAWEALSRRMVDLETAREKNTEHFP